LFVLIAFAAALGAQPYQPNWESLDKRPAPAWFTDAKFGVFIHWGVYSAPAFAPVIPGKLAYAEWYWNALMNGRNSNANAIQTGTLEYHVFRYGIGFGYLNFAPQFRAEFFDPERWADLFVRSGAKYVVLTSKHHDGFALWPSQEATKNWGRPWNSVDIGPNRDLVGDLTKSVRRRDLKMGLYYSLYEWYNPIWESDRKRYVKEHMTPQFKDLVTRYQPSLIFSDGEWDMPSADWGSPELLAWLFNESPSKGDVVVNDRWGKDTRHKHGTYWTTEYTPGMSGSGHPWEENRGMGYSYGYNRLERLQHYRSGRELVLMLADLVSRGGNFLLDIGPAADGTIPVIMEERLTQIGNWLRVNGDAIYGTRPWKAARQWSAGEVPKVDYSKNYESAYDVSKLVEKQEAGKAQIEAFFTAKGKDVYAILPAWPGRHCKLKDMGAVKSVALLGHDGPLRFHASSGVVTVDLPELTGEMMAAPAWVLKLSH
jgi:alpha-L-fucosidase